MPTSDLLDTPAARDWVDDAIARHSKGIFGKLVPAVIWSDARGNGGELLVPVDPKEFAARINMTPLMLLHNHDPGRPKGQVLESANFESEGGERFIAAILGFYAGGEVLDFQGLGLDTKALAPPPERLPLLPDDIWIQFATDPREVDPSWLDQVTSDAPLRIERTELSHNAAEVTQELIRVGLVYLAVVWSPFITSIASEAGKGTYAAVHGWVRKLLARLADRRNPILDIHTHQDDCQVSFLFRGNDVRQHYAAHDALPDAAAQAAQLVAKLKARGMAARQLIYEFDKEALTWFPSYAVLNDNRIITDNGKLIAIEQLPTGLSLGLTREKSLSPVVRSALEDVDKVQKGAGPYFSVKSIPDLASKLHFVQKKLFDEVWNFFVASGNPFPIRSLPRIIGKQSIQEAFVGLNGSLIYEKDGQEGRCLELTVYGAFLTGYGSVLASLLVRLLDLIKELYESDSYIKKIEGSQIKEQLGTSDTETDLLFKLLRLNMPSRMPFHLSGWLQDGSSWAISVTDEVIELFRSEDSVTYLDERLSAGYRPDEPCLYDDRLKRSFQNTPPQSLPSLFDTKFEQSLGMSTFSYVNSSRIEELKKIKNSQFDCTRLICMCEELNECASRGNAHAVIMLTRAILDHVPPAFAFTSFREVASNYGSSGASFKKSVERLENHSKKVADRLLHMPIRDKEVAPNMHEVSFAPEIETLLAEFCRLLK